MRKADFDIVFAAILITEYVVSLFEAGQIRDGNPEQITVLLDMLGLPKAVALRPAHVWSTLRNTICNDSSKLMMICLKHGGGGSNAL